MSIHLCVFFLCMYILYRIHIHVYNVYSIFQDSSKIKCIWESIKNIWDIYVEIFIRLKKNHSKNHLKMRSLDFRVLGEDPGEQRSTWRPGRTKSARSWSPHEVCPEWNSCGTTAVRPTAVERRGTTWNSLGWFSEVFNTDVAQWSVAQCTAPNEDHEVFNTVYSCNTV